MPKVSVVIPTYNCAEYADESIRSVFDQSHKDVEVIVVDGGSDDNIDDVMEKYESDPQVIYRKLPKCPIAATRNRGIELAKGDFIAFLDGDDLFLKDKLSRQLRFFEQNKYLDICYTNSIYFNSKTKREVPCTYCHFSGDIFYYIKRNNFIHPSCVMGKVHIFKENRFDETIPPHEDWELFLRLAYQGIYFGYMKEILSKIRVRKKSISTNVEIFNLARRTVGLMGKRYWKDFKKERSLASIKGLKAILRYMKFKIGAFLIGFPKRACFNRPLARDLVCITGNKEYAKA